MTKTRPLKPIPVASGSQAEPDPILAEPALRRMVLGATRGVKAVTVFYALTLTGFVLTLGHLFDGRPFGVIDVGFMYLTWGLFGGALAGLAAPLARGAASSILVATLVFIPLAIAVSVMMGGWLFWTTRDIMFVPIGSLFMGLIWGPLTWKQLHEAKPSKGT